MIVTQPTTGLTPNEIIQNANPFGVGIYGLLVVLLVAYIVYQLRDTAKIREAHAAEVRALREENKQQVEMMLEINSKAIPLWTNVLNALKTHEGINKNITDGIQKLSTDHMRQIELLSRLPK